MRFGDCNLRTVTQSFPRGRVSGFQVKTNFKVPRSYSGLPFTRDAYDSSKLSPSRSLPRFEDDPFTAGHVAMCGEAAPIIRWCTMRRVTRYTYSSHGISARKLAPCYFRDPRQRRTRPDEISILLARTLWSWFRRTPSSSPRNGIQEAPLLVRRASTFLRDFEPDARSWNRRETTRSITRSIDLASADLIPSFGECQQDLLMRCGAFIKRISLALICCF